MSCGETNSPRGGGESEDSESPSDKLEGMVMVCSCQASFSYKCERRRPLVQGNEIKTRLNLD